MKKIKDVLKKLITTFKRLKAPVRLAVIVVLFLLVSFPTYSFAKYLYDIITYNIYASQNFYFKSDFLAENNPSYTITNWGGAETYNLNINMNSILNELKVATMAINYEIEFECTGDVTCSSNKATSVIPVNQDNPDLNNHDSFTITMVPDHEFTDNEKATIRVKAKSTSPYERELSAVFVIKVEKAGLTYEITDDENSVVAVLRLTNSLSTYTVKTAFGDHAVGSIIQNDEYRELSAADKAKCSSMSVLLEFDPRDIQLDMTNQYFLEAKKNDLVAYDNYYVVKSNFGDYEENDIIDTSDYNGLSAANKAKVSGPYQYVKSMRIEINAISSVDIKFYKSDETADYSFPGSTLDNPIVTVS